MRLLPDQDERDLTAAYRAMLAAECPPSLARAMRDPAAPSMPPALWKALADSGALGLGLPVEHGGSGGTLAELGVFCVEAGRALCPTLAYSTVIAAHAISELGDDDHRARWLPGLSCGDIQATNAVWHPRDAAILTPLLHAEPHAGGWRLSGAVDFVADADAADVIVITAADAGQDRALGFVVGLREPGVRVEPLQMMGGYRLFRVSFDRAAADRAALLDGRDRAGLAAAELRRVANTAVALLSLDLVGVGEAVLAATVDYTKMRHQFGRPIASFQAAQHLVADMHIALAAARLAARAAVFWIARGRTATRETAVARMQAATAAKSITLTAHQLHGGMGYVTETDLHLWSERARVLSTLGGGADIAAGWLEAECHPTPC